MFYRHIRVCFTNTHYIQQTHSFIIHIAKARDLKSCVFIYRASLPAFLYYIKLDSLTIPHIEFDEIENLPNLFAQNDCKSSNKAWILASHMPKDPWEENLKVAAYTFDKNAIIQRDKGSILIEFSK